VKFKIYKSGELSFEDKEEETAMNIALFGLALL